MSTGVSPTISQLFAIAVPIAYLALIIYLINGLTRTSLFRHWTGCPHSLCQA